MFDVLPALGACLRTQLGTLTMAFAAGERERHVTRNAVRVIQNALSAPPGEDTCRSGYRPVEFHTNSIEVLDGRRNLQEQWIVQESLALCILGG